MRAAHDYVALILDRWTAADLSSLIALHSACVVAYARPFTPAFTRHGRVQYGTRALEKARGFDRQLHSHLVELRHRLIAHGDYDLLPSTMYVQTIGDEMLQISIGVNVKTMAGLASSGLAQRYRAHFLACMSALEERLNQELRELATEARKYPSEFNATHNVRMDTRQWQPSSRLAEFPGPTGPASDVEEPSFPEGMSGYRYVILRHQFALIESGTYTVHTDGKPVQVTFTVGPDGVVEGDTGQKV